MDNNDVIKGLAKLREPFAENFISKLPKPTKAQTDEVKRDFKKGKRCSDCGGWHHPSVVHLDYVGHAALTDRLLSVDPLWNWDHAYKHENGAPMIDQGGGFWIKLTVCGVTRLGYGDAPNKQGGDAIKECIGDALRNAAMRFGCALDLWHKGDLHSDGDSAINDQKPSADIAKTKFVIDDCAREWIAAVKADARVLDQLKDQDFKQFIKEQVDK